MQTEIGDKIRFAPAGFADFKDPHGAGAIVEVTGTVTQIHALHRWYRVRYFIRDLVPYYECFKF